MQEKRGCSEKKSETEVSEQGTTASGVAQDSRPVSISIISQPEQFVKDFHGTEDDVVAEFNACGSTRRKDQLGHPPRLVYHIPEHLSIMKRVETVNKETKPTKKRNGKKVFMIRLTMRVSRSIIKERMVARRSMMATNQQEKMILTEMGDGTKKLIPESKLREAHEMSDWLIETAIKAGTPREVAEKMFMIRVSHDNS